jgi:hypothetical protein
VVPAVTPVTTPVVEPTVATPSEVLLHVPPGEASLRVMLKATQTEEGPVMATGEGVTVTIFVVIQPVASVYVIVDVPGVTPDTTPPVPMVATAVVLLLHVPPKVMSDKEVVVPAQSIATPDIAPGNGFTVNVSMT